MTAFNRTPFGFIGWGLSWLAQAVLFHQSSYFSHSTTVADWGFAHGGRRAFAANGYNRGYGQPRGGYNSAYGQGFAGRSPQGYSGMRPGEGFNRGYQAPGVGYARPTQQAYNRMQPALNTTQYGRAGYGSSFYGGRPGTSYNVAQQAYRPPAAGFQRNDFAQRSPSSFGGKSFAGYSGKPANSGGGFHPFGGGHSEKSFGGRGEKLRWRPLRRRRRSSPVRQASLGISFYTLRVMVGAAFPQEMPRFAAKAPFLVTHSPQELSRTSRHLLSCR